MIEPYSFSVFNNRKHGEGGGVISMKRPSFAYIVFTSQPNSREVKN